MGSHACLSNVESVHTKLDLKWSRDSWFSCGFICPIFRKLAFPELYVSVLVYVGSHHRVPEVWETNMLR